MEREGVVRGLGPLSQSSTGSGGELVTDRETFLSVEQRRRGGGGFGEAWDFGWARWGHWKGPSLIETSLGKQSVGSR